MNLKITRGVWMGMLLLGISSVRAQVKVKGKIVDEETGEALAGVFIGTKKSNLAVSSEQGTFEVSVEKEDTLRISYVGYTPVLFAPDKLRPQMFIRLKPGMALEEVTVTASIASARAAKAIGANVENVKVSKLLEQSGGSGLSDILDGRISGVQMYRSNGKIGMPIRFNMRSGATLSVDRDPIIYIDGVRYNNTHTSDINSSQDALSALNDIPVEDIADIDVIKGPAAAASYGAEAANGVLIITTKRGSYGTGEKLHASVKLSQSVSTLARKYDQFVNNSPINSFFRTGNQTNLYANIAKRFTSGNSVYLSWNENHASGIVPGNTDKRHTLRAAYDMQQGRLKMSVSAQYTNGSISIPQTAQGRNDAIWNLMRTQEPWQYVSESTWRAEQWGYDNDRIIANMKLSYMLPFDIKFETLIGLDVNVLEGLYLLPYGYLLGTNDKGQKDVSNRRNANYNWDWKLNRKVSLGNGWETTFTLLSQLAQRKESWNKIQAKNFGGDIENISAAAEKQVSESSFEQRMWGLYGEAFINYDNRLFINAGLRRDASNLIGANVASIWYPSLSLAYNMKGIKLRTAYGESGRLPYPTDARTSYIMSGTSAYGPLVTPGTKGNPDIRPERMREWEAGADLFTGRHTLSVTGYAQFTSDAIIYTPLRASDGWIGTSPQNIGKVQGFGVELSWNGNLWRSADNRHSLSVFATANYQTNRVTDTQGELISNFPNVIKEGEPAYAFYYKKVNGAGFDKKGKYNGAVESNDYYYLGKPFPDFNGAWGCDIQLCRNLTIHTKFNYSLGASVYNQSFYNVAGLGDNLKKREELKKRLEQFTDYTSPEYHTVAEQLARTERKRANYIEHADFLRWSSLSVGYDASDWIQKISHRTISGCRFLLSGENLWLLTNYSGAEPQVEASGGDRQRRGIGSLSRDITNTPSTRTFTASVTLNF